MELLDLVRSLIDILFSNRVSLISLTVNAMIVLRVIQCGFRFITAILTAFIRTSIEYL